jgi:tetratricopeptide (TPR) repeat protein
MKDSAQIIQFFLAGKVAQDKVDRAKKSLAEARKCHDTAVNLAPKEPLARQDRVVFLMTSGFFNAGLALVENPHANPLKLVFSDECLAEVKQLADLRPEDPKSAGAAAFSEVMYFMVCEGETLKKGQEILEAMPPERRTSVQTNIARLKAVAAGKNRMAAAHAEEILGYVSGLAIGNFDAAQQHLRKAVEMDPSRDQAWDIYVALASKDDFEKCLKISLERLKHKDNAHNRFLVARSYEELGDHANAEAQIRLGLKQQPDDPYCTLGLAALLLRGGKIAPAEKELDRFEKSLAASSPPGLKSELTVLRSIHTALAGKPDRACDTLDDLLKTDKDNAKAKKARAALAP